MQAYRILTAKAQPELCQLTQPYPTSTQIRLRIRACGLNFADLLMQKGQYQDTPTAPFTLGMEVAGEIDAVGDSVKGFQIGDRVAVFGGQGGLAEYGVFESDRAVRMPEGMSFEHAAAFQIAYGTSHMALADKAQLKAGETLVVLGAAGGVGLTAVEIGKLMGARVIACARGADKLEVARKAGADVLLDTETDDLRAAIIAEGRADVVYDAVGGDAFRAAFRACNPEARILAIGFASGDVPQIPANHLLVKNITVIGFYWGGYVKFRPEAITTSFAALMDWYRAGKLNPHISHTFPLDRVAEGMELLRARKSTGKIVITP